MEGDTRDRPGVGVGVRWKRGKELHTGTGLSGVGQSENRRGKGLDRLAAIMALGIALQVKDGIWKKGWVENKACGCVSRVEMDDGFGISVTGNQKGTKEDTGVWEYSWD